VNKLVIKVEKAEVRGQYAESWKQSTNQVHKKQPGEGF